MIGETVVHADDKPIRELTDHEICWIYSLAKYAKMPDWKIGQLFKLSDSDVRKVIENFVEPWGTIERNLRGHQKLPQEPAPEQIEKPKRKRRSDAKYESNAQRQRAYRARLRESRRASVQLSLPSSVTDSPTHAH